MSRVKSGWKRPYLVAFGRLLQDLREAYGLSRDELASGAGTNRGHVRKLEEGWHPPRPEMVTRLAAALGVEPAALVPSGVIPEPTDDPPPRPDLPSSMTYPGPLQQRPPLSRYPRHQP